jgi:hypothetical protein
VPTDPRRFIVPIVCAFLGEGLLILVIHQTGAAGAPASLIFLVEAAILGFVFGPGPGMLAAITPVATFGVVDAATCSGSDCGASISIVVFLMLLLGFTAWIVGVLHRRYGRH